MPWETLRNPNTTMAPSVSEEYIVVPVYENRPVKGYAVIKLSDLEPQFKSLREAQKWADAQTKKTRGNEPRV